jgi:hypothetical protein
VEIFASEIDLFDVGSEQGSAEAQQLTHIDKTTKFLPLDACHKCINHPPYLQQI